ncbi:hypothetical protein JK174_05215, partial [Acetobacter thailandicus]|nr:hypothetical protein [Acetobacter thailandicus]
MADEQEQDMGKKVIFKNIMASLVLLASSAMPLVCASAHPGGGPGGGFHGGGPGGGFHGGGPGGGFHGGGP